MFCSLLFTGLLINKDILGPSLQWLLTASFFHAAYEALAVNELKYLQLKETKVGFPFEYRNSMLTRVLFSLVSRSMYPRPRSYPCSDLGRKRFGGRI